MITLQLTAKEARMVKAALQQEAKSGANKWLSGREQLQILRLLNTIDTQLTSPVKVA